MKRLVLDLGVLVFGTTCWAQVTQRVSLDSNGVQGAADSYMPAISADGRYVAFASSAGNFVPGDQNNTPDVFLRDRQTGTTVCISVTPNGAPASIISGSPAISANNRYVVFTGGSDNLVLGDDNFRPDVFVRDLQTGTTERVSVDPGGAQGNDDSEDPAISADGRYVVFESDATNLVASDVNGSIDVFLRDRVLGTTELVARSSSGTQGNNRAVDAKISDDGRYVAFTSWSSNLVDGDTNGAWDDFVRDRVLGITERMSLDSHGAGGDIRSLVSSISADGRCVALRSYATNLVAGDTNGSSDIFVRDRAHAGFASLCDPGVAGVIACPCSNPPSGPERGCDNSSATGGASLAASGAEYLSSDSAVFPTSGGEAA